MQSIGNSINELQALLENHEECACVCITEHWKTNEQLNKYGFENFCLATSYCRQETNRHGGCAIYVKHGYRFSEKKEISKMSIEGEFECCACEVEMGVRKLVVLSIYRPPTGNFHIFLEKLEQCLTKYVNENSEVVIAGDFNVDFLKNTQEMLELVSLINSFNIQHTISEYTRITHTSKSCIDNILTNVDYDSAEVLQSMISDHTAQKLTVGIKNTHSNKFILKRIFSEENKKDFSNRLANTDWSEVYKLSKGEVNKQWETFICIFLEHFNNSFPVKKIAIRKNKHNKVLSKDPEIIDCKNRLDILYGISTIDPRYKDVYKETKKEYQNKLIRTRAKNYQNRLEKSDNKAKSMWQLVNEILGKYQNQVDIQVQGDTKKVANKFNDFLSNIATQLMLQLDKIPFSCNIKYNSKSMNLNAVDAQEILEIVKRFKNKLSSGEDEVPTSIIKFCIKDILDPIVYIVNNSLEFGIFPDNLKHALVKPIHKKGDPAQIENYRPISLLSSFSKIFESVMCNRLISFMTQCNLFNEIQHGYQKGRSTQTAIFQFLQNTQNAIENDNLALGLFLDLSKAYDCLNHKILLYKLEKYGVRGTSLKWFESYLTDRCQKVGITKNNKTVMSDNKSLTIGVPQGSIAGPLLFIIYTNDLGDIANAVKGCDITNYADDTNVLVQASVFPELMIVANNTLQEVNRWFLKNKQISNDEKTNIVLFKTNNSRLDTPPNITLNNTKLKVSNETKFLGMYIDDTLSWDSHIDHVCKKINSICYSLRIISKYVNLKIVRTMYHANFEAVIRYGIIFYGSGKDVNRVFVIQKRVIRLMYKLHYRQTCRGKFRAEGLLTVTAIYIQECLLFFFKNKHIFKDFEPQSVHDTRNLNYSYPIHRLTATERGAFYNCIKLFNKLPRHIKEIEMLNPFKKHIHKLLIKIEPYNINEYINYNWSG